MLTTTQPVFDTHSCPSKDHYTKPHTPAWPEKVGSFTVSAFVTPEHNYCTAGAVKNAMDFLNRDGSNKTSDFVR